MLTEMSRVYQFETCYVYISGSNRKVQTNPQSHFDFQFVEYTKSTKNQVNVHFTDKPSGMLMEITSFKTKEDKRDYTLEARCSSSSRVLKDFASHLHKEYGANVQRVLDRQSFLSD